MKEPTFIFKNETVGIDGERIVLYYFTCEDISENDRTNYAVGIDMYVQNEGMRTTKESKITNSIFKEKETAEKMLKTLCDCLVTPTSLQDVIDDYIYDFQIK